MRVSRVIEGMGSAYLVYVCSCFLGGYNAGWGARGYSRGYSTVYTYMVAGILRVCDGCKPKGHVRIA